MIPLVCCCFLYYVYNIIINIIHRGQEGIWYFIKTYKGDGSVKKIQMRKLCASKVEWQYIYKLTNSLENENIRNYVTNQIEWYVVKANQNKFYEYALKFLTVVTPTVVIVLQQCLNTDNPLVQMAVLGGATVTSASSTFIKFHDKRVLYRKSAELIKEETVLYITHTGKYNGEKRDERFIMEVDRIVKCANERWGQIEEERDKDKEKA